MCPRMLMIWHFGILLMFTQQSNTNQALKCVQTVRASKKTVIMLRGFSVSKSMLALCVPNHINYLTSCSNPLLGICCTSLQVCRQCCKRPAAAVLVFNLCRCSIWRLLWGPKAMPPCLFHPQFSSFKRKRPTLDWLTPMAENRQNGFL